MSVHYAIVEGLRLPAKLSGHPALDFCNTFAGWDGHDQGDYLQSYEHLAVWAAFAELISDQQLEGLRRQAAQRAQASADILKAACEFRTRLYDVLVNGPGVPAFALVAEDVQSAVGRLRLRSQGSAIHWELDPQSGLSLPTDAVCWSAAQLLTSPDLALVRACPGRGCGWLFLDRRGRRRWCTMATCGNRAKVKRFATRQRGTAERE